MKLFFIVNAMDFQYKTEYWHFSREIKGLAHCTVVVLQLVRDEKRRKVSILVEKKYSTAISMEAQLLIAVL
jgi:hypothetical protein